MQIESKITDVLKVKLGFHFVAPPALRGEMKVVSWSGREAISELFSFDIVLSSSSLRHECAELETQVLGQPASLLLHARDQPPRLIQGVVASFVLDGSVQNIDEPCVRVQLVPRLWLATQCRRSRIFQEMSVPDIVDAVLDEWQVPRRWGVLEPFVPRTYCTQYQETDYQFVSRLLAEEGIYFYFDADQQNALAKESMLSGWTAEKRGEQDKESTAQLVLSDHPACYQPLPGHTQTDASSLLPNLHLRSGEHSLAEEAHSVLELALRREISPKASVVSGYDFRAPRLDARARADVADSTANSSTGNSALTNALPPMETPAKVIGPELVVQAHAGRALHESSPKRIVVETEAAKKALVQLRRRAHVAQGKSHNWRLLPGYAFHLVGHPFERVNRSYVVTEVEHHGDALGTGAAGAGEAYHNSFSCVPAEVVYRPAIPERPLVRVAETAVVEADGAEEILTDAYGRLKVRFHWDLASGAKGANSCWIRLAQSWAGAGFGFQFLPRVGAEVVITFLHGDPDNPLVTGCVYNGVNPWPKVLPGDKSRSGIRTASTPGGWGYNELSFEDAAGAEEVLLHAQRNLIEEVGADRVVRVEGNDRAVVVGHRMEVIKHNQVETVVGDKVSAVLHNHIETVGGEQRVVVKGPRSETVEQAESRTLNAGQTLNVTGGRGVWVTGFLSTQVGVPHEPSEAVTTVFGKHTTLSTEKLRIVSHEKIILECGESRVVIGPKEVRIETPRLAIDAKESAQIKAAGPVLEMAQDVELVGKTLKFYSQGASVELAANADINGAQVNLNCGAGVPEQRDEEATILEIKALKLRVQNAEGETLANKHYRLVIAGETYEDETDGSGYLIQTVPKEAKVGQLTVWVDEYPEGARLNWPVELDKHSLPPTTSPEGALPRLRSLGYYSGEVSAGLTAEARAAVMKFQADNELEATGDLDGATVAKLEAVYSA